MLSRKEVENAHRALHNFCAAFDAAVNMAEEIGAVLQVYKEADEVAGYRDKVKSELAKVKVEYDKLGEKKELIRQEYEERNAAALREYNASLEHKKLERVKQFDYDMGELARQIGEMEAKYTELKTNIASAENTKADIYKEVRRMNVDHEKIAEKLSQIKASL